MQKVFSYMIMDSGLGEAYVRSDIDLSTKKDHHQNPKATLKRDEGILQVGAKEKISNHNA